MIIGHIDSGVDTLHPELVPMFWHDAQGYIGFDFYRDDPSLDDEHGHGTHTAGIVAAATNNGIGVAGIAGGWNEQGGTQLMVLKVLDEFNLSPWDRVALAVYWAATHGANILSMSLGGTEPEPIVKDAIDFAYYDEGCVIVAGAGNNNVNIPMYPAYFDECIAVGSTNFSDKRSYFSRFGDWVDVSAPGGTDYPLDEDDILSTTPTYENFYAHNNPPFLDTWYDYWAGTSMACPYVSGLAGLILSQYPGLTNQEVRERILGTVDIIHYFYNQPFDSLGTGRINAYKALTMPEGPNIVFYGDTIHNVEGGDFELSDEIELDEEILEDIAREWQGNGRGFGTTLENLAIEYARKGITCLRYGYFKLDNSYIGDCSEVGFSFENEFGWVILDTINIERTHTGISSKSSVWLREGVITECDSVGLHFDDCGGFIWKADINQNGIGILTSNSASPSIWYADITENTTAGIYTTNGSKPRVRNSKIIGNSLYGVYITDDAKPNFGIIGHNSIHGSGLYDLYNNTDNRIKAKRNYWGTMDIDTVEAHIYDYYDDNSLGKVQVEPLWEGEGGMGGVMSAGVGNTPFIYSLKTAAPNPFENNTTIFYSIEKPGNVSLKVYDVTGRLVKTIINEKKDAGVYNERWNGRNNNNRRVAAGVYFTRLASRDFTSVKKVILMK